MSPETKYDPAIEYDFDPRNLPSEALAAIGLSVACAAQTEMLLQSAIGGCLGLDAEYTFAVTTHMAMPLRFDILKAAAELRIDDLDHLDRLDEILKEIKATFEKRNEVAHNSWCMHPVTKKLYVSKWSARGTLKAEINPVDVVKVRDDAIRTYFAGIELMDFLMTTGLLPSVPMSARQRGHKSVAARKKRREGLAK